MDKPKLIAKKGVYKIWTKKDSPIVFTQLLKSGLSDGELQSYYDAQVEAINCLYLLFARVYVLTDLTKVPILPARFLLKHVEVFLICKPGPPVVYRAFVKSEKEFELLSIEDLKRVILGEDHGVFASFNQALFYLLSKDQQFKSRFLNSRNKKSENESLRWQAV
jgi:hypothetical protein